MAKTNGITNFRGCCIVKLVLSLLSFFFSPHLCFYCLCKKDVRGKIKCDDARWKFYKYHENYGTVVALIWVLLRYPEFRTLFYHRIGKIKSFFCRYLPGRTNLYIMTPSDRIGGETVGEYSDIGAGAVIVKDIPPKSVVVPSQARIVKKMGKR